MSEHSAHSSVARFPLELQLWLSASFPVGSFAYSHGLEWAVGEARVHDRASALAWLADLVAHGAPRNDAIILAHAWRAAGAGNVDGIVSVNTLALAMAGSRERLLETAMQGNAFMATVLAAWTDENAARVRRVIAGDIAYPVAVGVAAGARQIDLRATISAFAAAQMQTLTSALVRLAAIGQTDAQIVLAALAPNIFSLAEVAPRLGLDDLGGAAFLSDIAAMAHETQETRLFRS
jgi:urease accessory protein